MSDPRLEMPTGVVRDPLEIVPRVGLSGQFLIKPPFNFSLSNELEYTVIAVTSVSGMLAEGKDPWKVYQAVGASEAVFEADRSANRTIMTLQSGHGETYVIPTSAVQMLPVADGVRYVSSSLMVLLGALPETHDLTGLMEDVRDLIESRLGIASAVEALVTSAPTIVSHDEHAAIEVARDAKITERLTGAARLAEAQRNFDLLQARYLKLEAWVAVRHLDEHGSPNAPPPAPEP